MRCRDAIHLMAGYVEQTLPDHSMKAMKRHLQICSDCRVEYIIWKESNAVFKKGLASVKAEEVPERKEAGPSATVESVMDRLAKEERWSFPVTRRAFRPAPSTKRLLTTVSILFMLVFGVLMWETLRQQSNLASNDAKGWERLTASNIVLSLEQLRASEVEREVETSDIRLHIIAGFDDPLQFNRYRESVTPNAGLAGGFLGILITVVTMSWLSRTPS